MAKNENLLASLIVDIKSYSGKDHLLPWIRGVKKMKESLPTQILNEKLPRFLQKCAESFESDQRYKNDSRYIRVWLQLMDFVDDPKALLRTMEAKSIGTKRSLFYQAYALYYEKMKRFEEAKKMYRLGVQNLAEPMDELQKSYMQFLSRMERHKKKKTQLKMSEKHQKVEKRQHEPVLNFVDKAIVGKPEAENACHHGLVDPTINMKEAMNAINNMFKEPIETAPLQRRSQQRSQNKENEGFNNSFKVFVDENLESETGTSGEVKTGTTQGSFEIFIDDENCDENDEAGKAFVFLRPRDHSPESSEEADRNSPPRARFREDTVVRRFVGSTISDEPEAVENACHHGLVDPTVNLKEAMEDINNMFGEPIDFVRPKRSKSRGKAVEETKPNPAAGFSILEDDDDEEAEQEHQGKSQSTQISSSKSDERDLFEPTVCTKVALDEINKLFAMPIDF
ncbi:Mitotic spindle checkpoint protein BUBR1 [Cardamine amara subsp. amara]|uniref:Mitotic spindle checkpoint protein BUBR1 n=1 Tax=Cardamine amara subsp. amara TaxID=228776 RepID=A0ABD0ZQZ3_CARAN